MTTFIEVTESPNANSGPVQRMLNVSLIVHVELDPQADVTIFTMSDATRFRCNGDLSQLIRDAAQAVTQPE